MGLIKLILCFIMPPVAIVLHMGVGKHFWLNLILTLLGGIPGVVHAVWVLFFKKAS